MTTTLTKLAPGTRVIATCPGPFCLVAGDIVKATENDGYWVRVAAAEWPVETPRVFVDAERAEWMFFCEWELEAVQ